MATKKPYTPAKVPAKAKRPGCEKFLDLCKRRWKFTSLGTWVVRDIRNKPGQMSQHAAALAIDLQYTNRADALQACDWFVKYADELGIALINDYMAGKYGRTWLCSRAAWKTHTTDTIGIRGSWLHVELHKRWADMSAEQYDRIWRSLPRP